jgi:hypothetical protein
MIRKDSPGLCRPVARPALLRAAFGGLALVLAGCSATPEWAKPTTWYDSVAGGGKTAQASAPQGGAEPPPAAAPEPPQAGQPADASSIPPVTAPAAPEPAKGFPNLGSVPDRPELPVTSSERANVVAGLAADRNNARYTDEELRGGTEAPAAPPRANEAAPEPLPGESATTAPPAIAEPTAPMASPPPPPAPVAAAPPAAPPPPATAPPPAVVEAPPAAAPAPAQTAAIPPSAPPSPPPSSSPPDFNALFAASGAAQMGAVAASVALDADGALDAAGRQQVADVVQAHSGGRFRVVGRSSDGGVSAAEAVAREMVNAGAAPDAVVTQGQADSDPARADIYIEN